MWLPVWTVAIILGGVSAHMNVEERLKYALEYMQSNATLRQLWDEHVHKHAAAMTNFHNTKKRSLFRCHESYTHGVYAPRNVHELRPEDISVVAAMGDSLTAGNGILAWNIFQCLTEYRGHSWSIGGDYSLEQGVETLPNFLKKFSYNLKGYSMGDCSSENEGCSQLNVAIAGNVSSDMPMQARELIHRMKSRHDIDYQNEWKLITLFIGGNDLCDYCNDPNLYRPEAFRHNIEEALDILHANVPRAFVNLVEIFDITPLGRVSHGLVCDIVTNTVCKCAKDASIGTVMTGISREYQRLTQELVSSGKYDTRDNFTVVLQPFFRNTVPPQKNNEPDMAYFSLDCFHFSDLGHYAAAKSLWNNMFQPVGQKDLQWTIHEPFHCPHTHGHKDGIFRTRLNS